MVKYIGLILFFSVCVVYSVADQVTVVTGRGAVVGDKRDGYNTFLGVPYARVNEDNPFGATLEYPKFLTPFNANDSSVICPQVYFSDKGVLQCLRLNIYTPQTASFTNRVPILVWFHGGGFAFGSGGEYGAQYLVQHEIVVITVNYRQGAYGFFCLNNPAVPGNQGMKDQIEALRWIQKHIANFGGDPNAVTIAGESYGGGAVDYHMYSKYERLFDKAIIQSGSMYVTEGIFIKPDYRAPLKIARYLKYDVNSTNEALKVLAKTKPADLNAATRNMSMILTLCREKKFEGVPNFVTEDPFHLQPPQDIRKVPVLIGFTNQEMLYEFANKPQSFYDALENPFVAQLRKTFALPENELLHLGSIIQHFYLGGQPIGPVSQLELSNFFSDYAINYGVERSVKRCIDQGQTVYKYVFSYTGGSDYQNITGAGASHTEELKYLFDWVWASALTTPEQQYMRDRMTTMWANFVKTGNPTPQKTGLLPEKWIPVTSNTWRYMNIDVDMTMKDHGFKHRMAFWDLFWHMYLRNHVLFN